jgi:hypothetical protein
MKIVVIGCGAIGVRHDGAAATVGMDDDVQRQLLRGGRLRGGLQLDL